MLLVETSNIFFKVRRRRSVPLLTQQVPKSVVVTSVSIYATLRLWQGNTLTAKQISARLTLRFEMSPLTATLTFGDTWQVDQPLVRMLKATPKTFVQLGALFRIPALRNVLVALVSVPLTGRKIPAEFRTQMLVVPLSGTTLFETVPNTAILGFRLFSLGSESSF